MGQQPSLHGPSSCASTQILPAAGFVYFTEASNWGQILARGQAQVLVWLEMRFTQG